MRTIAITFFFIYSAMAFASSKIISQIPNTFSQQAGHLSIKGMGYACLGILDVSDGLPCQPAFIARSEKPSFAAQVFVGNGYQALKTADEVLNKPVSREFLRSMFDENQIIEMEGSGDLIFKSKFLGARFTPYRINYLSVVRNKAYPTVSLHVMQEKSFVLQGGYEIYKGLYAGAQGRLVERKFVHEEFTIYDVLAEGGDHVLKPKEQKGLFF